MGEEHTMNITDKVKNAAVTTAISTALNYLEKDPENNIPKVMDLVDRLCPDDWYTQQRAASETPLQKKAICTN